MEREAPTSAGAAPGAPSREETLAWLAADDPASEEALFRRAYEVKVAHIGRTVNLRGIVEFSNICSKNCYYCGIRRDNRATNRYQMTVGEILECARWAHEAGYGSVVLQAGERSDARFIAFVEEAVSGIKGIAGGAVGVTLSLGEQSEETYRRWFAAGAHRYLLRIEASNPALYARLHPGDHSWEERVECLRRLRRVGYQVGTGVMIGIPGQTLDDLAGDVLFYRELDVDMVGMGPYVVHHEAPLRERETALDGPARLRLALRMIAATRLALPDINIAAATALQSLHPEGREMGIRAGANIIMPNVTPTKYRAQYQLYDGKPCLDENAAMCRGCLARRIEGIGETIALNSWGDSRRFARRAKEEGSRPGGA